MSPGNGSQLWLSEDSDEEDLASKLSKREPRRYPSSGADDDIVPAHASASANNEGGEDPDWVRDFAQPTETGTDRRRTLFSAYDNDDSSIEIISDKDEPREARVKTENCALPEEETGIDEKPPDGVKGLKTPAKTKGSAAPKDSLPLVFAPKLEESLVLVQGDDDALDLSGDIGAVGRMKIDKDKLFMDIKGVLYSAHTYSTNTMCIVSMGEDEARITSVLDEAVVLKPERDILASEELIAGCLDDEDEDDDSFDFSEDAKADAAVEKEKTDKSASKTPSSRGRKKATPGARKSKVKPTTAGPSKSISKPRKKNG